MSARLTFASLLLALPLPALAEPADFTDAELAAANSTLSTTHVAAAMLKCPMELVSLGVGAGAPRVVKGSRDKSTYGTVYSFEMVTRRGTAELEIRLQNRDFSGQALPKQKVTCSLRMD
jgi:hypothetical protein